MWRPWPHGTTPNWTCEDSAKFAHEDHQQPETNYTIKMERDMRFDFKVLVKMRSDDLRLKKYIEGIWFKGCPTALMLLEALGQKYPVDDYYMVWGDMEKHVFPRRVEDLHNPLPGWSVEFVEEPDGDKYWKAECVLIPLLCHWTNAYWNNTVVHACCHCCAMDRPVVCIDHPDMKKIPEGRVLGPCAVCEMTVTSQERRMKKHCYLTRTEELVQRLKMRALNWGDSPLRSVQFG